jgi:Lon-like protease
MFIGCFARMSSIKDNRLPMTLNRMNQINLPTDNPHPKIKFGFTWLAVIPVSAWAISTVYIPLFSEHLSQAENWAVTLTILLLMGISLYCHVLAHLYVAHIRHDRTPNEMSIFIFGDAAQSWPVAASSWNEALIACAGFLINILLSGLAYLLWNAQINVFLNLVALFISVFNIWLFAVNLLPAFPMDGGRIIRACLQALITPSSSATILIRRFGFIIALALTGWGIVLNLQNSRFSPQTALITFALVIILLDGLRIRPAIDDEETVRVQPNRKLRLLRFLGIVVLILVMLGAFSSTLMTNNGIDAPGVALSVEPMVNVPAQYRHTHKGSFILTTVFSNAPILVGEWMMAQVNPAMLVVAPETVVPKNTTVQEQARQDYQMLDDSEATAITVGLRLAGYQTQMTGKGVRVESILPESHANGILQTGDVITALNGEPIRTTDDLIEKVRAQSGKNSVQLEVERNQETMELTVPLIPPASPSDTPKIGITIDSAGYDFKPPFPVSIVTQKISGGPSAGLMFTLTVYNALSAQDLTGGRKIAGTGTINLDGTVGPIGGVKQKVAAAEATGAHYFLCPVDNYADAVSVARSIKVVRIATVQDALDFLHSLPAQ